MTQFEGEEGVPPEQYHPLTFPEQSDLHFDVPLVSPSSQNSSGKTTFESPQKVEHTEIWPVAPVQYQPDSGPEQSNLHILLSSTEIPSSQISVPTLMASQQVVTQDDGLVESPPVQVHPITLPEQEELHLSVLD